MAVDISEVSKVSAFHVVNSSYNLEINTNIRLCRSDLLWNAYDFICMRAVYSITEFQAGGALATYEKGRKLLLFVLLLMKPYFLDFHN